MRDDARGELVARALGVVDGNRCGTYTCPSRHLYPHQWLWDSCFTAIGLARVAPERAADELRSLLRGQWANGMVPHMVFAPGSHDVGSAHVWRSRRRPGAPRDVATTCITQPPMLAVAVERVAAALAPDRRERFLDEVVPKVVAHHRWLVRERVRPGSALVTLVHPWECGLDSTPPWMGALHEWPVPEWLRVVERIHLARLFRALRYDTRQLPASERASDDDGLRMVALAVHLERHDFHLAQLPPDRSVLIEDVAFNAIFAAANQALLRLADGRHGEGALDAALTAAFARHATALEELWHASTGLYCSRDAVTHAPLPEPTVAGLLPLWPGCAHADDLLARMREPGWAPSFPVPSVPVDAPDFHATRYWKGPTWMNTNWMLVEGLAAHGDPARAAELREASLQLVGRSGFAEYFSPLTGEGHGAPEFSWTAALAVDLATCI